MARSFERTSAGLRRLLYGYKAALDGLLLVAVLVLANLLPYTGVKAFSALNKPSDWTRSRIYTLSPGTQDFLEGLKEPVKVYVLLNSDDEEDGGQLAKDVEGVLENFRTVSDQVTWEMVSPDRRPSDVRKLDERYKLPERFGLLVVYGAGGNEATDFVKRGELEVRTRDRDGRRFVGENALVKSIDFLANNKAKKKIYFTQGQGELSATGGGPAGVGGGKDSTMRDLWQRLGQANYEVRELRFEPGAPAKVPDDADLVVIARPHRRFSPDALAALGKYMDEGVQRSGTTVPGRLFILLDVYQEDGQMLSTGLEGLIGRFGVKVEDKHLMGIQEGDPNRLQLLAVPFTQGPGGQQVPNPIGRRFTRSNARFTMTDCRSVDAAGAPAGRFQLTPLLMTAVPTWQENNLNAVPADALRALINAGESGKADIIRQKQVSDDVRFVSVMVAETTSSPGRFHGGETPRMVVVGSGSWVSDQYVQTGSNGELFSACAAWLMQRPDIPVTGPDKPAEEYTLEVDKTGGFTRLVLLPGALAALIILALGGGVWLVRRR